jgi:hypothetical protein
MQILKLDENFKIVVAQEGQGFEIVADFFSHVLHRDTVRTLRSMLENKGVGFETDSCEMELDPGEEPFEGVKFQTYRWWLEDSQEILISIEDFKEVMRVVAKSHLHSTPEDEVKLKKLLRHHEIEFEC